MDINEINNEIGKAVVNKGLKKAQETGENELTCVNEIWKQIYGENHEWKKHTFCKEKVNWEEIFRTLY